MHAGNDPLAFPTAGMDPFVFSLILGGAGLATMAVSGLTRHSSAHSRHGGGRHGHAPGGQGRHAAGHHAPHGAPGGFRQTLSGLFWSLLSPRVLFSLLVGFGATGLTLRHVLPRLWAVAAALVGAALLELILVAPLWRFLLRFESNPALTLESAVLDLAHAVTTFDAAGQGLVAVELDGQVVQILATLRPRDRGERVRAGDRVRIEEVDAARNRCTVSVVGP
jgi:membrane protein implicated in regulation of membrane protease activity